MCIWQVWKGNTWALKSLHQVLGLSERNFTMEESSDYTELLHPDSYALRILTLGAAYHVKLFVCWGCVTQIGQQSQMDHRPDRWMEDGCWRLPDHISVRWISPPPQCIHQILCNRSDSSAAITHSRAFKFNVSAQDVSTEPPAVHIPLVICFSLWLKQDYSCFISGFSGETNLTNRSQFTI